MDRPLKWLWLIGLVVVMGAHPGRVTVTDQTTDTAGTDLNASLFSGLQSNMENDIEDHRHTGGAEGRTLASTALSAPINIGIDTTGTITSLRISPVLNRGTDFTGTLTSNEISPALTFSMLGGTLSSSQLASLNLNQIGGTLSSTRVSPNPQNLSAFSGTLESGRVSPNPQNLSAFTGTLESGRISPALTFPMIGGTLVSQQINPALTFSSIGGTLASQQISPALSFSAISGRATADQIPPALTVSSLDSTQAIRVLNSLTVLGSLSVQDGLLSLGALGMRFSDATIQTTAATGVPNPFLTSTVTLLSNYVGTRPPPRNTLFADSTVKAWVITGDTSIDPPTILASFNMSVRRSSAGVYLASLATPMATSGYSVMAALIYTPGGNRGFILSDITGTSQVTIYTFNVAEAAADRPFTLSVLGSQLQ